MGKFPFKRSRIISKKFPEVNSSIDGVKKSLNDLVFSYSEKLDRALQKKHILMALSSMVLLVVLGSFINPHGKAETATFYPDTCLGGWVNPHNAEGILQTTSNGDASQFTKNNSAVLPKNTDAEMYCGSFKGKFEPNTRPTKIVVSLALTKGDELLLEDRVESGSFASSSAHILDAASTTDISFTLTSSTSSEVRLTHASSTSDSSIASSTDIASTSSVIPLVDTAIATPVTVKRDGASIVNGVVQSVQDAFNKIFDTTPKPSTVQTDTVVVPILASTTEEAPRASGTPQSYLPYKNNILLHLVDTVFAQEEGETSVSEAVKAAQTPKSDTSLSNTQTVTVPTIDTPVMYLLLN